MSRCVYAGSFDPITFGHLWMIEQGSRLFDELIVAIGINPDKRYMFSLFDAKVQTVFLIPPRELIEVSSSFVKGLVGPAGWESVLPKYVPRPVVQMMLQKAREPRG